MSEKDPMDCGELTDFLIPKVDGGDGWAWSIESASAKGDLPTRADLILDCEGAPMATEAEAKAAMLRAAKHARRRFDDLIKKLEGK